MDPEPYSFDGERYEALCLLGFGQDWNVPFGTGQCNEEQIFSSEDAACVHLKRIFQLQPYESPCPNPP